jgi:hypothetical protein
VPRYDEGRIELDCFQGEHAGSDFQYVKKLEAGEQPTIACRVRFRCRESDQGVDLGKVVLRPVPGRTGREATPE